MDFRHLIPNKAAASYALGHLTGFPTELNQTQAPAFPYSKAVHVPKGWLPATVNTHTQKIRTKEAETSQL